MIETNLAIDISNLQSDICGGGLDRAELLERLSVIKNKSLGVRHGAGTKTTTADSIVEGYRVSAIGQLESLLAMASSTLDGTEIPPMKLAHISCCAELYVSNVMQYFRARNAVATREMMENIGIAKEVDRG